MTKTTRGLDIADLSYVQAAKLTLSLISRRRETDTANNAYEILSKLQIELEGRINGD